MMRCFGRGSAAARGRARAGSNRLPEAQTTAGDGVQPEAGQV